MNRGAAVRSYAELRKGVNSALVKGMAQADKARVRTYWDAGEMISEHLLATTPAVPENAKTGRKAAYGRKIIVRLSRDLEVEERLLYRCVRFSRRFPNLPKQPKLGWSHYRLLSEVDDGVKRAELEAEAEKKEWSARELEVEVRKANAGDENGGGGDSGHSGQNLLKPKRGRIGVYRLRWRSDGAPDAVHGARGSGHGAPGSGHGAPGSERMGRRGDSSTTVAEVDLGFAMYLTSPRLGAKFSRGDAGEQLVRIGADGIVRPATEAKKGHLFTYRAKVERVVDGDTIWFKVELRPGEAHRAKIRLRGLDCPELRGGVGKTKGAGARARRFVEELVSRAREVVITTTKPDKYDRYLSDVFLRAATDEKSELEVRKQKAEAGESWIYLNNELLKAGLAELVSIGELRERGKWPL